MDVDLVRWPGERDRLDALRAEGRPRLLVLESDLPAPISDDPLEDWIRMPAAAVDVQARVEGLSRRFRSIAVQQPELDEDGVLRVGEAWVAVPPLEGRLLDVMLDRFGAVVSRDVLTRAGWPDDSPGRNALDVHVLRLRRRLGGVGLAIRTVRSRGYLLEHAA